MKSYLINGGPNFMQRGLNAPFATFNLFGSDTYVWDQWKVNSVSLGTFTFSLNGGLPGTQKMLLASPIEAGDTKTLQGKTVKFGCKFQTNAGNININIGILQWSGTEDTLPALTTSWNPGAGNDPIWNSFYSLGGKTLCVVNSTLQDFSTTITINSNTTNLLVVIWYDDVISGGLTAYFKDAYLILDGETYEPRLINEEFDLCQRYCQLILTVPNYIVFVGGYCYNASEFRGILSFPVMRKTPIASFSVSNSFLIQIGSTNHIPVSISGSLGTSSTIFISAVISGGVSGLSGALWSNNTQAYILLDAGL